MSRRSLLAQIKRQASSKVPSDGSDTPTPGRRGSSREETLSCSRVYAGGEIDAAVSEEELRTRVEEGMLLCAQL